MDDFPIMHDQDGVIARHQVLEAGGTRHDIDRLLRRRIWSPLLPATYVNHTGTPTWGQYRWGASLFAPGAALADETVLALAGVLPKSMPIHLAIPHGRRLNVRAEVVVHRMRDFQASCVTSLNPPRMRLEPALLRVGARREDPVSNLELLVDALRSRRTTADRLVAEMEKVPRLPHRAFLLQGLIDSGRGLHSVLERTYLHDVERCHGLPPGTRQKRSPSGVVAYRDVEYEAYGLIVELDGALGHSTPRARRRDMDRDLRSTATGAATIRLGWDHVANSPCSTAALVARCLRARGWTGLPIGCTPNCPLIGES
jgi:hypothetical protein